MQNDSEWAEEKFKEVAEAHEALLVQMRVRKQGGEVRERVGESFKCRGCAKEMRNKHAFKCHLQLYPGHR